MPPISPQPVPPYLETVSHFIHAIADFTRPTAGRLSNGLPVVQFWINSELGLVGLVTYDDHHWYLREAIVDSMTGEPRDFSAPIRLADSPREAAMLAVQPLITRLCATVPNYAMPIRSRACAANILNSIMANMESVSFG